MKWKQIITVSEQISIFTSVISDLINVGAPTEDDASQILIQILDLRHPLSVNQPLHQYLKQKRSSDINAACKHHQLGCVCTYGNYYTVA